MSPKPDHGEKKLSRQRHLAGKVAIITGRISALAVQSPLLRGADVLVSYFTEHKNARETAHLVGKARRKAITVPGDVAEKV